MRKFLLSLTLVMAATMGAESMPASAMPAATAPLLASSALAALSPATDEAAGVQTVQYRRRSYYAGRRHYRRGPSRRYYRR